jgi:ATP-dependent Clp protease ATP-binding subunit ClpA
VPLHDLPLILVTRKLDDADPADDQSRHAVLVGEALFFPELTLVHDRENRLAELLRNLVRQTVADLPPLEIHRRLPPVDPPPTQYRLSVTTDPPRASVAWREPVTIELDVLQWRQCDEASIAYVPALGIEIVAARDELLAEQVPRHVRLALARARVASRLFDLAQLARVESVEIERQTVGVEIRTPAQIAADRSKAEAEEARLVIDEVGTVLSDDRTPPAYEIDASVARLADALAGRNPRSVLLVGPSGAGKTAAFGELFRQRAAHRLAASPFWATSGARLIAGTAGFGLWQQRCQKLCRQAKRAGAVLHVGNLVELMEVGKAGGSNFGLASFFRPYLTRGDVLAVAECTPEQLPLIERDAPQVLAAFEQLRVDEPSPDATRLILLAAAVEFAGSHPREFHRTANTPTPLPIDPDAIDAIDRLHRRYATYSAAPGRPLRFLRNLMLDRFGEAGAEKAGPRLAASPVRPISAPDVTAAFSRETGLPRVLLDERVPLDLGAARASFGARVIGQHEAVGLVTDLLATVKAALNRPRRPIASLLFVGPTGVGKTEMAKALAEFFFEGHSRAGDRAAEAAPPVGGARLLRFDMSEYATPAAVARLVGTAWDAEGLLTARVREQAFCVVLLDEFEKAHPAFFDLLLQVLGEGRLTDSAGRLADFSNAIVVMTSNLGAESFGAGPFGLARRSDSAEAAGARDHFTETARGFLRPELFNRIDRVVPFLPLDQATIERIAAREVDLITRRDGVRQRDLRLDVSAAALRHLAAGGYEPLYGARPLKRKIERDLLAPLADALNGYAQDARLDARVDRVGDRLDVRVRAAPEAGPRDSTAPSVAAPTCVAASDLRRLAQAVARCPARLNLQNELFQLRKAIDWADARPGKRVVVVDAAQRERLRRLSAIDEGVARLLADATRLEDALLLNFYESAPLPWDARETAARITQIDADAELAMLRLASANFPDPDAITLAFFGSQPADLFKLARAYRELIHRPTDDRPAAHRPAGPLRQPGAAGVPGSAQVSFYTRAGRSAVQRQPVPDRDADAFLDAPRGGTLGIVLAIRAPFARARFDGEGGLHAMVDDQAHSTRALWVDASPVSVQNYQPPKNVEFRFAAVGQRRRTYHMSREEIEDEATKRTFRREGTLAEAIGAAVEANLRRRVRTVIDDPTP